MAKISPVASELKLDPTTLHWETKCETSQEGGDNTDELCIDVEAYLMQAHRAADLLTQKRSGLEIAFPELSMAVFISSLQ